MAEIHAYIGDAPVALNGLIDAAELYGVVVQHVNDEIAGNKAIQENDN